jgi:dephospho-CoA kinase
MHKIAIIGPLGAGKSEIVRICAEKEYPTISADHIAKMLLDLPGIAHDDVIRAFPSVADVLGRIDRHRLAEDVFHNYQHLELLESIIHPHVWQVVASFFMECENKHEEVCFVEVSAPDDSIKTRFDEMWCVNAKYDVRKTRCIARGMSEEDFDARNNFQQEHCNYEELASRVILNESTTAILEEKITDLLSDLSELRA